MATFTAGQTRSPEPNQVDDFYAFAAEVKASQWDVEYNRSFHDDGDLYYDKFQNGEVVDGWSYSDWTMKRMAGCKRTSSRHAHTATRA